ncbi:hypothetical protein F4780DRAFT_62241 [Xylariomycetidae sp. FL0641]|nr:hypothetical protein F4780DRAFT_62241 [Xylariomycetidae sp. FL0641]
MEKYSQFRDRGSGISPFLPNAAPTSFPWRLIYAGIFAFRLPLFLAYGLLFFLVLDHLPPALTPQFMRKLFLWTLLGIPGIWWIDLQLDGVKRGSLSSQPPDRFPHARSVIAAQFTSPVDAVYLAAVFDPLFVVAYPGTRKVRPVSLFTAACLALRAPKALLAEADNPHNLTTLRALLAQHPDRVIACFPELTPTNGKGILPLSPALLATPHDADLFPVSMRYTPADIATPVPGAWAGFLWRLLSRPTHYIRVRIAEGVRTAAPAPAVNGDHEVRGGGSAEAEQEHDDDGTEVTPQEQQVLDRVAEDLARLARNRRVGLTLRDKAAFVEAWNKPKGKKR